eukprot:TRINITY_DN588_c0_g1_i2.p1 TRINITY_DN588_c0_g1~~TRINITY_DN588_c0_g1_i2.p1  ORF type:complete len:165 (-),score=23.50 TRINITY_DN588_c0_g1_i2:139-633(-)
MLMQGFRTMARRSVWGSTALGVAGGVTGGCYWQPRPVSCEEKGMFDNLPPAVKDMAPLGTGISIGSICGFCSGFALKKAGKAAAFVFGAIYAAEQGLAYLDYISINWPKVEKDLVSVFDVNKDGKVDEKDLNFSMQSAMKILTGNTVAISSGFGAGFLYGVKKG